MPRTQPYRSPVAGPPGVHRSIEAEADGEPEGFQRIQVEVEHEHGRRHAQENTDPTRGHSSALLTTPSGPGGPLGLRRPRAHIPSEDLARGVVIGHHLLQASFDRDGP